MSQKDTEVELRAFVPNEAIASRILADWSASGKSVRIELRFLIDYSTYLEGVEQRTRDIRVRSTDGRREIVVKLGDFASAGRREAAVVVNASLAELTTLMGFMGFTKGVAALRRIHRCNRGQVELALQEVLVYDEPERVYSRFVEVETVTSAEAVPRLTKELERYLKDLGLRRLRDEEWYSYIHDLNEHANGVFEYGKADLTAVAQLGL